MVLATVGGKEPMAAFQISILQEPTVLPWVRTDTPLITDFRGT